MKRIVVIGSLLALVLGCSSKNKQPDTVASTTDEVTTEVEGPTSDPGTGPTEPQTGEAAKPAPSYLHGKWVWFELHTKDAAKATAFYTSVFGWTAKTMPMGDMEYTMLSAGPVPVGGLMGMKPDDKTPSHWMSYVSVPDVDAAATKAGELGGKVVVPATDIPNVGRFAMVQDPQGAMFALFKSAEGDMPDGDMEKPAMNTFFWNELNTSDPEAAVKFYTELAGYSHQSMPMPGVDPKKVKKGQVAEYHMLVTGSMPRAGVMKITDKKQKPAWLAYIVVDDVDATLTKVKGAGGKVIGKAFDIPTVGRIGMFTDPTGAMVAIMKPAPHDHGGKAEGDAAKKPGT